MLKTGDFRTYGVHGDGILAQKSARTVYVIRQEGVKRCRVSSGAVLRPHSSLIFSNIADDQMANS